MNGMDLYIEQQKSLTKLDYIDVIIDIVEEKELDFEDLVKTLHPSIIDKLKYEFVFRNMVKNQKHETSIINFM